MMMSKATSTRERLGRLSLAFGTDFNSVGELVKLFTEINKRWNNPKFIKDITPPLDVAVNASVWEISSAVKRYFMTDEKTRYSRGESKNVGVVRYDANILSLELADLASEGLLINPKEENEENEETKKKKGKKKTEETEKKKTVRTKGPELDLDKEMKLKERSEIDKIYDAFAAYLATSRITSRDIADLFFLSDYALRKDIRCKEFCGPLSNHASLSSRLDQMWTKLDAHGIHARAPKSRYTRELENERRTEYQLVNCEIKRPKIE